MYLVRLIVGMDYPPPIQVPQQGEHSKRSTQRSQQYKKKYDSYKQAELIPNTTMIVKKNEHICPHYDSINLQFDFICPQYDCIGHQDDWISNKISIFSCPEQLLKSSCPSVGLSVGWLCLWKSDL